MSGTFNGQVIGVATDQIWSPSGELLQILQTPINASTLGNNSLVAAVTGKRIYVVGLVLVAAGATTVEFRDGASTPVTGAMSLAANGQITLQFSPATWFNTSVGAALTVQLSAAVNVAGCLKYVAF